MPNFYIFWKVGWYILKDHESFVLNFKLNSTFVPKMNLEIRISQRETEINYELVIQQPQIVKGFC